MPRSHRREYSTGGSGGSQRIVTFARQFDRFAVPGQPAGTLLRVAKHDFIALQADILWILGTTSGAARKVFLVDTL